MASLFEVWLTGPLALANQVPEWLACKEGRLRVMDTL